MLRRLPLVPFIKDFGGEAAVINVNNAANANTNFRTALWTGNNAQLTLMSIPPRSEIGEEIHLELDQFIRVENGRALIVWEVTQNSPRIQRYAFKNDVFFIPAGTRHNIINIGHTALKLSSVYAPPNHPFGTAQKTKQEADAAEQ